MDEQTERPQATRCGWCRTRQVAGATVCPACGRDPSGRRPPAAMVTVRRAAARAHEWWPSFVAFVAALEPEYGKVESRRRGGHSTPSRAPVRQAPPAVAPARQAATPVVPAPSRRTTSEALDLLAGYSRTQARPDSSPPAVPAVRSYDLMAAWRRIEQEARVATRAPDGSPGRTRAPRADPTGGQQAPRPAITGGASRTRPLYTRSARELAAAREQAAREAEHRRAAAVAPAEVDRQQVVHRANVEPA